MSIFGTVLLLAITALHVYVLWRAVRVVRLRSGTPRRLFLGTGTLLWAGFVAGRALRHEEGAIVTALQTFSMNWIGVVFLTGLCLLAVDVCTGFGLLLRRFTPVLRGGALAAGALLSGIAFVQARRPPVVEACEVAVQGLPRELDGTVLVALSDLHLGATLDADWLAALVRQVRAEKPDLVVIVGDVFEGRPDAAKLRPALRQLTAPHGVFAVPGNHDHHGDRRGELPLLAETGHAVLRNRWVEARPGLVVAGVDDLTTARRRGLADDLVGRALEGRPAGATVLLSHTPWDAERAAAGGVGLMLSGHTHGGQIWPFGHLVRQRYPYFAGRYQVGGMTLITSRGAGTWGPRMRLWRRGEILRVTLRAE